MQAEEPDGEPDRGGAEVLRGVVQQSRRRRAGHQPDGIRLDIDAVFRSERQLELNGFTNQPLYELRRQLNLGPACLDADGV